MDQILSIYTQFLNFFPKSIHGIISLLLAALLVVAIFKVLKKNFIYIIVLVILLPASVPILRNIWEGLVNLVKFLLTKS